MSNFKYVFYCLIVLVVIGLVVASYYYGRKPIPVSGETVNEYRTTLPVQTTIIRERLPAIIDTVYVDNHAYELASYKEVIDTNKVHIELDVKYNEYSNLFDIRHNISTVRDSIYVERIITKVIDKKHKLIGFTGGTSIGFSDSERDIELYSAGIDLGIKLAGKYSASAFIDTKKTFGVRLGVDF